jgi:stage IV sporulation protein B
MVLGMNKIQKCKVVRLLPFLLLLTVFFCQPIASFSTYASTLSQEQDSEMMLIPGGMPFGVQLQTKGVLVVGISSVDHQSGRCPASEAGISVGDIVLSVNKTTVDRIEELTSMVENSEGKELLVSFLHNGKLSETKLFPIQSSLDGKYKAGIWVRDSTAGIGTVTFLVPGEKTFAGLGHGICDPDLGILMPMSEGSVMSVTIGAVKKGKSGSPGELKGYFSGRIIGSLEKNTVCGVYGKLSSWPTKTEAPIPVGKAQSVRTGNAYILCTLDDQVTRKYSVKITKILDLKRETKNFVLEITDPELLEKTGGIVQGMSGSPIIQDGKLIGAVTHVLVENPAKGYGIFIENMLEKMPESLTEN